MNREIIILPGDGIGSEIVTQAIRVLDAIAKQAGIRFNYVYDMIGNQSRELTGSSLLKETLKRSRTADAILLGTLSQHAFDEMIGEKQNDGIRILRRSLGIFASLHVIRGYGVKETSKNQRTGYVTNLDIQVFQDAREANSNLNEGVITNDSVEEKRHSVSDVLRVARQAFRSSAKRRGRVHVIGNSGSNASNGIWFETIRHLSGEFPEVSVTYQTIEETLDQLTGEPMKYDVLITDHHTGKILINRGTTLVGSEFMIPGADLGAVTSVFSPWHGPHPELEGTNQANPFGMILTTAMMLEHLGIQQEADHVKNAVRQCLESGRVTRDIDPEYGMDTDRVGDFVLAYLD